MRGLPQILRSNPEVGPVRTEAPEAVLKIAYKFKQNKDLFQIIRLAKAPFNRVK
jgi:hypothetical protein